MREVRVIEGGERARQRAEERERRASERLAEAEARQREETERMKALRPERPADGEPAPKRRATGALRRTGEARIVRDTRSYSTVVDKERIRLLSARGSSVSSLAAVFGISLQEVEAALSEAETR
ncbi:MAG: hypothetical protein EOP61_40640 [Sphingomonadales bacterium]|nr:MAG: hypothetical protein EOP61_40640 [Sphingomonadales bacterium]